MKKLMIALFVFAGLTFSQQASAQVSVNINIGSQPAWGPSGYSQADFYYIPAINSYYDINRCQYIYLEGNRWIYGRQLPPRYRGFDMYRSYKVVMNQADPFRYNRNHINQYGRYRNYYNQPMNRDNRDYRNYGHNGGRPNGNWNNGNSNNGNNGNWNNGHHGNNGNGPGYADNRGRDDRGRGGDNRGRGNDGRNNGGHGNGRNGRH